MILVNSKSHRAVDTTGMIDPLFWKFYKDNVGKSLGELVVTDKQMYIRYKLKEESEELSNKKFSFEIKLP